jgi:ABC-type enterobactin transport system permease subunit
MRTGGFMQMAITFMAVVAGLIFSVAVALLAEELIFGQVFRLFFIQQSVPQIAREGVAQTVPVKAEQKR